MTINVEQLHHRLAKFDQSHLVGFWYDLAPAEQLKLFKQIEQLDLSQLQRLVAGMHAEQVWSELATKAQPPTAIRLKQDTPFTRAEAIAVGEQALRDGKVAMVLVAGGQGTRLGFDLPKGMYPLGPVSNRTLFQIHFEKVLALGNYFGSTIPLFVMTSPATHEPSVAFLQQHQRFGIAEEDLKIFCQGTMPAVDSATGKIILSAKGELFTAPDGHGGTVAALHQHGCLQAMKQRGIEHVFYCQVDNPLVQICDPLTIGYHVLSESEMTTQACPKRHAEQKVGNIVEIDSKVQIIEYSDLPNHIAAQRDSTGALKLWAGNIAVHVFDLEFLCRAVDHAAALPFHRACKKVPYISDDGEVVEPEHANAIKFERFIFDLLPMARNALVVEVDPANSFAPVKNALDAESDTPHTAQTAMMQQARKWLRAAGARIEDSVPVEISPLFAISAEQLATKIHQNQTFESATYLR